MAQKQKRASGNLTKGNALRRGGRNGGQTSIEACACEVDLKDSDPIESYNAGVAGGCFKPVYAKPPKCTGTNCAQPKIQYTWTLTSATPAQAGGAKPEFRGPTDGNTCNVINAGQIKLKLEVNVTCERPGDGGVYRQSFCSDSGEVAFRIP
jgi:hypothetical protein